MEYITAILDEHSELLIGGAGDNVPNGFYDPETGEFSNGRAQSNFHSGMGDVAYVDGSGYARILPNGKIIQWGVPIF